MKNKNYVSRYLFHLLKQFRAIAILYAILYFLAYPFTILMQILTLSMGGYERYVTDALPIYSVPILLILATLVTGLITPYIIFSYLYKRADMDTYFALPIRKSKLFLIQTFFAWIIQIVPILIMNSLGYVIAWIASKTSPLFVMNVNHDNAKALLFSSLIFMMGSFFFMVLSILAILCTTSLFNGIVYGIVLNAFPYVLFFLWQSYQVNFPGFTSTVSQPLQKGLTDVSTIGLMKQESPLLFHDNFIRAISALWENNFLLGRLTEHDCFMTFFMWVLFAFVLSLPLLALATYLYKIRKVERIQSTSIFRYFYPIVIYSFGVMLLMSSLKTFIDEPYNWYAEALTVFLVGFALYYVVQIIRYHGWPKFFSNLGIYILVFIMAFGLNFTLSKTQTRILTYQVPKLNQIGKAQIVTAAQMRYDKEPYEHERPYIYFEPYGTVNTFEIFDTKGKEDIDHVRQIHKAILKDIRDNNRTDSWRNVGYHEDIAAIQIYYYDAANRLIMVRTYDVYDKDLQKEIEMLIDHPLYPYQIPAYEEKSY